VIDLYYYTSPNARKALIALEELGLDYRVVWTDISAGDQFTDAYRGINPNSKVPAIVDSDGPGGEPVRVFESGAVLLYLAEKTGRLMPADPGLRWEATSWLVWQVANHGPMAGQAAHFHSHAPKHGIVDEYATRRYVGEVERLYEVLDERLREREYLADELSMADVATYPWVRVAAGHGVDVTRFPAVGAWVDRLSARPAFRKRLDDPREDKARRNEYTREQFTTLFRATPPGETPTTPQEAAR
jgi:GSH-dependent disulfide-bond oxidoreductase